MVAGSIRIGYIPSPRAIASVERAWAKGASATTAPAASAFQPAPPTLDTTNRYLWLRLTTVYTDGTSEAGDPACVGSLGQDGVGSYQLDLSNEMLPVGLVSDGAEYRPASAESYRTVETQVFVTGGDGTASIIGYDLMHRGQKLADTDEDELGQYAIEDLGIQSWDFSLSRLRIVFSASKAWAPGAKIDFLVVANANVGSGAIAGLSKGFSVVFQPPGADGATPLLYDLAPAEASLCVDKDGAPRKASASCRVRKSYGETTTFLETSQEVAAEGLRVECLINGSDEGVKLNSSLAATLPAGSALTSFEWRLYRVAEGGDTMIDREDIAVASDGQPGGQGPAGQSSFKSFAFKRSASNPGRPGPLSGSYYSPVPSGWSDGIPAEDGSPCWMTSRVFTSDGLSPQEDEWAYPAKVADTADIDFCFSASEDPGTPPSTHPTQNTGGWHDAATESDIWMAVSKKSNGEWGEWSVSKIKGEKGEDAASYLLIPSPAAVTIGQDGGLVENTLSCSVQACEGGATSLLSTSSEISAAGLLLKLRITSNGTESYTNWPSVTALAGRQGVEDLTWLLIKGGKQIAEYQLLIMDAAVNPAAYSLAPTPASLALTWEGYPAAATALSCSVAKSQGGETITLTKEQLDAAGLTLQLRRNGVIQNIGSELTFTAETTHAVSTLCWELLAGTSVIATAAVQTSRAGAPGPSGPKGAKSRQRKWAECSPGDAFTPGEGDDEWYDIVVLGETFYECKQAYAMPDPMPAYPPSPYFSQIASWPSIATDILLAQRAVIPNLGTEFVYIEDAEGTTKFSAYIDDSGEAQIYADHGHFHDCAVSGPITAEQMMMRCVPATGQWQPLTAAFYSALYSSAAPENTRFTLLPLPAGYTQTIEVMLAGEGQPSIGNEVMAFAPYSADVKIITNADTSTAPPDGKALAVLTSLGLYRLTGWREDEAAPTYWNVTHVDGAEISAATSPTTPTKPSAIPEHVGPWGYISGDSFNEVN